MPEFPADGDGARRSATRLDRDTVYVEGGRRGDGELRHRRYVTVEHPDYGHAHQAFACLGEMPATWTFPYGSGEWLWHLDDQLPFPVDWTVRIERVDNQQARRRALRAKRNLAGQMAEPGGDPAGPATTLAGAADAAHEHRERLEANPTLPSLRTTTIIAVAHQDLTELERYADTVEGTFRAAEFNFYRPTGAQLECLTAMLPGAPKTGIVGEYAQDLLPDGFATGMPFAGSGVGDPTGMLLGVCLDTQYSTPVFLDPPRGPRELNRSGSVAAIGELGSGKSFFAKTVAHHTVAAGGQVVAIDRTELGEYANLASVMPGTTRVVELDADADVCLDPFQVFSTDDEKIRYGVGFITLLTATPPGSVAGTHCYRAAKEAVNDANAATRAVTLRDVAGRLHAHESSKEVADKLDALSGMPYGRLVFTDTAEPVELSSDYVCFHLPGLPLPRRDVQREDVLAEELIGQSVLYLITAMSRRMLFAHQDRFSALLLDEAHALTRNTQGRSLVTELIRDGRKHDAAVWMLSQLATDFTTGDDATLEALLGYRAVFRQPRHTAESALAFLGSEPRPETIETVTSLNAGECLLSDLTGRLGIVRIDLPADPAIVDAFSTTPGHRPCTTDRWASIAADTTTNPVGAEGS